MQIALTTASYQAQSIIAEAQRCVNLYTEQNPQDAPYPVTHYPTPGLLKLTVAPLVAEVRGLYTSSNGLFFVVVANKLYTMSNAYVFTLVGTISSSTGPVSMKDNTLVLVLVDGSSNGWCVDLTNLANFSGIISPAFYGANKVDYLDTFFLFNRPGTNQFYCSLSNVTYADLTGGPILTGTISNAGSGYTLGTYSQVPLNTTGNGIGAIVDVVVAGGIITSVTIIEAGDDYRAGDVLTASVANLGGTGSGFTYTVSTVGSSAFDPLFIAAKTGNSDLLQTIAVMHRELSLIGVGTSEIWYDSGASDFPFQAMPGAFIEHGCEAVYSVAKWDLALFWLGQDANGNSVVFQENSYRTEIVSTAAISHTIAGQTFKSDAIGFCYQQAGHAFYVLTFPTDDRTFVYDIAQKQWHERAWADSDGNLHRWRPNCLAVFNNQILAGDFENGAIYLIDTATYEDDNQPIPRIKSFPHQISQGNRVVYRSFLAQMQVGEEMVTNTDDIPVISLRWSDDYGRTYSNAMEQSLGNVGEYLTSVQYNRLGMARDRVFEISWSSPMKTALNGAYIQVTESAS